MVAVAWFIWCRLHCLDACLSWSFATTTIAVHCSSCVFNCAYHTADVKSFRCKWHVWLYFDFGRLHSLDACDICTTLTVHCISCIFSCVHDIANMKRFTLQVQCVLLFWFVFGIWSHCMCLCNYMCALSWWWCVVLHVQCMYAFAFSDQQQLSILH